MQHWVDYLSRTNLASFNITDFLRSAESKGVQAGVMLPNIAFSILGGGNQALLYGASILDAFDSRNPQALTANTGSILQLANYAAGLLADYVSSGVRSDASQIHGSDPLPSFNRILADCSIHSSHLPGGLLSVKVIDVKLFKIGRLLNLVVVQSKMTTNHQGNWVNISTNKKPLVNYNSDSESASGRFKDDKRQATVNYCMATLKKWTK
ncbi:hypothetical protein BY996DRAFT_6415264 [Phakopsora pachyrhizi]|nr:hypothetical protein BY996DRAFT_6415264 [Phakopsora pachyrhizi]